MSMILDETKPILTVAIPNSEATISAQINNIKDSEVGGFYTNDKDEVKIKIVKFLNYDYDYILDVDATINLCIELQKYKSKYGFLYKDSMTSIEDSLNYFKDLNENYVRIPNMFFSGEEGRYFKFENSDPIIKKLRAVLYGEITGFNIIKNDVQQYYLIAPFIRQDIEGILGKKATKGTKNMEEITKNITTNETKRLNNAYSKIYYGIPGCGKSWVAKEFALKKCKEDNLIVRTTFYPDYTNSDFVGQIIPKIDDNDNNSVLYDIQCGPFTEALLKAIDNPNKYVCLIVEEINRGNAAAIFGDLFQLLDRDSNGTSEYWIKNYTITEYLKKYCTNRQYDFEHIRIPSNLYLIGTMNTSDQNVFTLDTAFKRRWTMEYISNDVNNSIYKDKKIPGLNMTWSKFVDSINYLITHNSEELGVNGEDKQIGAYFISGIEWNKMEKLIESDNSSAAAKIFAEKVLSYLWEDVAKIEKDIIFKNKYYTFDNVVKDFINNKEVLNIIDTEE